ncbi:MAG: metallophosphoesterase [Proteobacteria bacterium]|nr:metallophosphoesterase [Pseudomonadota bacterium]
MKLYAISDLHIGAAHNRDALGTISRHPDDWLILGGDICETVAHLDHAIRVLESRFARLIWVPGNHELWTLPERESLRGQAKYDSLIELCRRRGVLTPEDPYEIWPGEGGPHVIAPLFLLYDYSFHPDDVPHERALEWALASGIECVDEHLLHADPHPSRAAWCAARCRATEERLSVAMARHGHPSVLINHFPLRRELAVLPRVPRFTIWCGTRRTEEWHRRFRASAVVYGHLHIRRSVRIDGVRFEEVSLGNPGQWDEERGIEGYLRQILP